MKEGFIIAKLLRGRLCFAPNPCVHPTESGARLEAERLAVSNPGINFIVFRSIGTCCAANVTWK